MELYRLNLGMQEINAPGLPPKSHVVSSEIPPTPANVLFTMYINSYNIVLIN